MATYKKYRINYTAGDRDARNFEIEAFDESDALKQLYRAWEWCPVKVHSVTLVAIERRIVTEYWDYDNLT